MTQPLVCGWCSATSEDPKGWFKVKEGELCPECSKEWRHLEVAAYQKLDRVLEEKFKEKIVDKV